MRIIIVEDEIKIREGMAKLIESQTDHIVVGEAADGEEGLNMILRFKPDLVITDIRMPKMDGLEMIKSLYEQKILLHIVILSGYSEFEYAKTAIKYGVDDYLLKPLAAEDIQKMLKTIEDKIEKEQLKSGTPEIRIRNLILEKDKEIAHTYTVLETLHGFPHQGTYEMFECYVGSANVSYREELHTEIEALKKNFPDINLYYVYIDNYQKSYLLAETNHNIEILEKLERTLHNHLVRKYQNQEDYAIWTKQRFTKLSELKQIVENLDRWVDYALVISDKAWICSEDVKNYRAEPFRAPTEIYSKIRTAICRADAQKLQKAVLQFLEYMERGHFGVDDMRREFTKNYYMIGDILQDVDKMLYHQWQNTNFLRNIEAAVTFREIKRAYNDVITIINSNKNKREDISNYVIRRAIDYIREHYQDGITQEEISRELEITPEYLSTLFNREMGINFSTFLKEFRMSHAKRLLKGTELKIYEIAKATGYSDSKYFQRVFKETVGVSPGEYRQMH